MFTNLDIRFSILFFLIVISEIITGSIANLQHLHYFTKPAIVLSLIIFFSLSSNGLNLYKRNLTIAALVLSLTGDIALMFVERSPHFFTIGLLAFFLAHIMYCLVFFKSKGYRKSVFGYLLLLLIYASGLFYLLKDGLGAMLIPVVLYMVVIITMAAAAFLRRQDVNSMSYFMVLLGAILFMISDSILALNKFYRPIYLSHISIMTTYALAQYLIVLGILKNKKRQAIF